MNQVSPNIPFEGFSIWRIEERDLWKIGPEHSYTDGDILIFVTDRARDIHLGEELAKAENEESAIEFLKAHLAKSHTKKLSSERSDTEQRLNSSGAIRTV